MRRKPEPNTPILVGVGQFTEKDVAPELAMSPMDIAAQAAKSAVIDTGCQQLVSQIDTISVTRIFPDSYLNPRVPNPFGRAENPPRAVARRLGANPERAIYGTIGGNTPQKTVNEFAERISRNEIELALLTGSEAINTAQSAIRGGIDLQWQESDEGSLDDRGMGEAMSTEHERAHGITAPTYAYPLFENAIRGQLGHSISEHMLSMGKLFEVFTHVAANNPFSFYGQRRSAQELAEVTAENRMISFPYPKWMNSRDSVNQGAAVIMTSVAKARALDIDPTKWVFLHGCGEANDKIMVTDRVNYHSSPALKLNSKKAFQMAGKTIEDMSFMDIYSCFPSAVEVACEALGLQFNDNRGLTVTGGLPFFGGPGNNYSMHGIATMVPLLRKEPDKFGLITANGGRLTKHATGIYSATPTLGSWQRENPADYQAEILREPSPDLALQPSGWGKIETYTVACDRQGPRKGIVVGRLADGRRFLANTPSDEGFLKRFMAEEQLEKTGSVSTTNGQNLFTPH
ncbi:MAG: acetyl-CoA acetyltransferase [Pseudohongiellaceae bacterium]